MAKRQKGKALEEVVAWINAALHESAEVLANRKLPDKDTGKPRQIDILIRLRDGPTVLTAIVEVRDRGRPVGVEYIEEIANKRTSVAADAACVVSRSGYTASARRKAEANRLRLFSYSEAKDGNWSEWLQCRHFSVRHNRFDNVLLCLGDTNAKVNHAVIRIAPRVIAGMKAAPSTKVLCDQAGHPIVSIDEFVSSVLEHYNQWDGIVAGTPPVRRRVIGAPALEPRLWVESESATLVEIGAFSIEADCSVSETKYPLTLNRYRQTASDTSLAEVATAEVVMADRQLTFELLVPGASDVVPKGATVELRVRGEVGDNGAKQWAEPAHAKAGHETARC